MLDKLLQKYPGAETYVNEDCRLPELKDRSCDVIVSTLTIAHMKDVMGPFGEWNRVLKPQGRIILTDYHPALLAMGAQRTFRHEGKTIALVNYVHGIDRIREVAKQLGWEELRFRERVIDETMRVYYERQGALSVYEKFVETPVIYGICWEKT
jgi:SAM-dependent methyltransferase